MPHDIELIVDNDTLDELNRLTDTRRRLIKIDPELLNKLLIERARMHRAISEHRGTFRIVTPRKRVRL